MAGDRPDLGLKQANSSEGRSSPDGALRSVRSDTSDNDAVLLATLKGIHGVHLCRAVYRDKFTSASMTVGRQLLT